MAGIIVPQKPRDILASFFPVPRFLRMPAGGLDITDWRVRFLEFQKGAGGLVLGRYGETHIPSGVIVSGGIKRPDDLRAILTEFRAKHDISFVRVSLPEERAYLTTMDVPDVSPEEIRGAIGFQIEEHVPIAANDAVFDYHVLGPSPADPAKISVAVSVFPESELRGYVDMFSGTGIIPIAFEIEAHAIARALVAEGDGDTHLIFDFGGTRTGISIVSKGIVRFTSTIDVGSAMLTKAIEKSFSVSAAEAEKIKNTRRMAKGGTDREFFAALASSLSVLYDEVNKIYLYWHGHGGKDAKIHDIILCGGGANLHGLPEYFGSSLRTRVSVGNPWVNVNSFDRYIPEIMKNEALGYTSVIGLALSDA
ncbi:MAG: pilus assembly protein PilM [Patescibacteria group bacterium]